MFDTIYDSATDAEKAMESVLEIVKGTRYGLNEIADPFAQLKSTGVEDATAQMAILANMNLASLDEVERNIRRYGDAAMSGIITETADWTTTRINNGLERAIGSAGVTANMEQINRQVVNYVARRFESDGLVLSDRVWRLAGDERDKIASVLRTDILRGESVGTMIRNVRRVHDNDTWKIERLVALKRRLTK